MAELNIYKAMLNALLEPITRCDPAKLKLMINLLQHSDDPETQKEWFAIAKMLERAMRYIAMTLNHVGMVQKDKKLIQQSKDWWIE